MSATVAGDLSTEERLIAAAIILRDAAEQLASERAHEAASPELFHD